MYIRFMDFHGIDLNLLAAFDALMDERNVTRAAVRVGVSQPAMSAALARLRVLLKDPLFLRGAKGLVPTQRARDVAEPVSRALREIESALVGAPAFMPGRAQMTERLGLSDYPAFVLLPGLMKALADRSPGVSLDVRAFSGRDSAVDLLDAGTIDAAIGVAPTGQESRILTRTVLRDEFVTILRKDSPSARRGLGLKTFLALEHVLVSPEGDRHGLVDQLLAQAGKRRTLRLTLAQMFATPAIVAGTDLAATVPRQVVLTSPARRKLVMFPPPVALPGIAFDVIWHRRNDAHPAQQWLRSLIAEVAATVGTAAP
jgi:DNA-binding transcriptional LysR family regulator